MAKKRALVDAVLTSTAASDIFTQDLEEDPELHADIRSGGTMGSSSTGGQSASREEAGHNSNQSRSSASETGENAVEPASNDEIVGYLSVKNVKHETGDDGTIYAYPEFSDSAARTWLKDHGFKWDAKNKRWAL